MEQKKSSLVLHRATERMRLAKQCMDLATAHALIIKAQELIRKHSVYCSSMPPRALTFLQKTPVELDQVLAVLDMVESITGHKIGEVM
jgi:hypothetical protein